MIRVESKECHMTSDGELYLSLTEALDHEAAIIPGQAPKRRIEHDGVIVLLPTNRKDRENAHALLWLAGSTLVNQKKETSHEPFARAVFARTRRGGNQ